MNQSVWQKLVQYMKEKKEQRIWKVGMGIAACLVVFCTVYTLILPAMTMEQETFCGDPTHEHTLACYSDPQADTEEAGVWEATLPQTTGDIRTDMVSIAESQVGYRESEKNYEVMNETELKGYTRYGAWAGDPYGDWNAYFTQFVMHYAGVDSITSGNAAAMYQAFEAEGKLISASSPDIQNGDLIFYTGNGQTMVGVISEVTAEDAITAVCGNEENSVTKRNIGAEALAVALTDLPAASNRENENVNPETEGSANEVQTPQGESIPDSSVNPDDFVNQDNPPLPEETIPEQMVNPEEVDAWAELGEESVKTRLFGLFSFRSAKAAPIDMRDMITKVTLKYKDKNGTYVDVPAGGTINENDEIRCDIAYKVPANTLSKSNNTISYDLPVAVVPGMSKTGEVVNNSGMTVGTYTIKDKTVTIQFNDRFTEQNSNGQSIDGTVRVEGHIKNTGSGESSKIELVFNDKVKLNVVVEKAKECLGDLATEKTFVLNKEKGLLEYTVTLKSTQGTYADVIFKDDMEGAYYESGLKVVDKQGKEVKLSSTPKKGAHRINLTLPQMGPKDQYVITYTAKVDPKTFLANNTKGTRTRNTAEATSKDNLNGPLKSSATAITKYDLLGKKGKLDKTTGTITWTVEINKDKALDLSGWKLVDTISNSEAPKEAVLTDSKGHSQTISLDPHYTFPKNSHDSYTLTYKTKLSNGGQGITYVLNTIQLYNGSKREGIFETGVEIGNGDAVIKSATSAPVMKNGVLITPWKVTIKGQTIAKPNNDQFVTDILPDGSPDHHYFTGAQIKAARNSIEESAQKAGNKIFDYAWEAIPFEKGSYVKWDALVDTDKYSGFVYAFDISTSKTLKTMTYEYETTAVPTGGSVAVKNKVDMVQTGFANAHTEYLPQSYTLQKYDPSQPGAPDSQHYLHELKDGVVTWKIALYIPEDEWNSPYITLTEELPAVGTLTDLHLFNDTKQALAKSFNDYKDGQKGQFVFKYPNKRSGTNYKLNLEKHGNKLMIGLPQELSRAVLGQYEFTISMKLDPNKVTWTDLTEQMQHKTSVTNHVTVSGGKDTLTDEQTQVIIKDDRVGCIKKDGAQDANNIVTYNLTVNPQGADLLPGSEMLTLTDTVTTDPDPSLRCTLVPQSVIATEINTGKPVKITYELVEDPKTPNVHKLVMLIPDQRAIKITYKYKFSGVKAGTAVAANNTADLLGVTEDGFSGVHQLRFKMSDAGATANIHGIEVYKVDKFDNGEFLKNATFELDHWTDSGYRPVMNGGKKAEFVTDNNGYFKITNDTVGSELAYNTAYRLRETHAPDGYFLNETPYEFYIYNPEQTEKHIPDNFTGYKLNDGALVYYKDEKSTTSLYLVKKWNDVDGSTLAEPGVDQITVTLYKKAAGSTEEVHKNYTLKKANNWSCLIEGLPKQDDKGNKYTYRVAEVNVPGFTVSYDETEKDKGIITIKNQKEAGYQLPETGGPGIFWYLLTGAGLMIFSLLTYRRIHVK